MRAGKEDLFGNMPITRDSEGVLLKMWTTQPNPNERLAYVDTNQLIQGIHQLVEVWKDEDFVPSFDIRFESRFDSPGVWEGSLTQGKARKAVV